MYWRLCGEGDHRGVSIGVDPEGRDMDMDMCLEIQVLLGAEKKGMWEYGDGIVIIDHCGIQDRTDGVQMAATEQ